MKATRIVAIHGGIMVFFDCKPDEIPSLESIKPGAFTVAQEEGGAVVKIGDVLEIPMPATMLNFFAENNELHIMSSVEYVARPAWMVMFDHDTLVEARGILRYRTKKE